MLRRRGGRGGQRGGVLERFDLEVPADRLGERLVLIGAQAADQPVGREHGEARVLERDKAHEHVAVRAIAANLLGVHPGRLVAVMAVGDQQLCLRTRPLDGLDRGRVGDPPEPVDGPVIVSGLRPRILLRERRKRRPRALVGIREQREDRREVRARGAGEPQPVLLRPRMSALVWPDPAGAIVLHPDASEESAAGPLAAVGSGVVLGQCPDCRLLVTDDHALIAPLREQLRGVGIPVPVPLWEVDADDVVGRAGLERRPLLGIDHVVGRGNHVLEPAGPLGVVTQRQKRLDIGHRGGGGYSTRAEAGSADQRPADHHVGSGGVAAMRRLDSAPRRGVAQPGSAPPLGGGGPRFESGRPDVEPTRSPVRNRRRTTCDAAGAPAAGTCAGAARRCL